MKFRDEAWWNKSCANNTDPYGAAAHRFALAWADLMEARMLEGRRLEECAKAASHEADTAGITWFMYGCAVGILSKVWEHGEELRRWHNLETQIGREGEDANEAGGVLNPALIRVGRTR